MANHAREKRGVKQERGDRRNTNPPSLTVVSNVPKTDDHTLEPTITDPASWTLEFCLKMADLAREDKNPLPPHTWVLRGHTIAHAIENKKKHPYIGMPVNGDGRELPVAPPAISGDFKSQLLSAVGDRVTMNDFAPPSD
jgi:hypothetical protein